MPSGAIARTVTLDPSICTDRRDGCPSLDAITDSTTAISTTQLAIPESVATAVFSLSDYTGSSRNLAQVSLASDNVFGEDGGALQIPTVTGSVDAGYAASLVV